MTNREENNGRSEADNQGIGKKLYKQDKEREQQRYGYRGQSEQKWDEGNFFHTGPSRHGAQDNPTRNQNYRKGSSPYNQGQSPTDHYGSSKNSAYRNEKNYINHGDNFDPSRSYQQQRGNTGSSPQGNYNEPKQYRDEMWREHPGSPSRYKEDDYRYGSGSHNWYREGRYTPDESRNINDNRGFFERMGSNIKNTWNDIMHSDDPDYQRNYPDREPQSERISSRNRYGSEQYRDRGYDNGYDRSRDKGYEGGPRWADETDSGDDSYYNDTDRNQRYRR